jgi:hypothetical protein
MVGGIFIDLCIRLKKWSQDRKLKNAIDKADWMAKRSGRKFLVLKYKRRLLVKSKEELKRLIKEKYFVKGFTIQQAEQIALYITRNS